MDESVLEAKLVTYDESIHDLIEELLWEYFTGEDEDTTAASLAVRRRRLERERETLTERKRAILESVKDIDAELEMLEGMVDNLADVTFDDVLENLKHLPAEKRDPSNPAIQKQAKKVGLSPQQFVEKLEERYPLDAFGDPIEQ